MTCETTHPPALAMPSCIGKEMGEGGSVLGEAKHRVSVPGHWWSLLTSWLGFQLLWLFF